MPYRMPYMYALYVCLICSSFRQHPPTRPLAPEESAWRKRMRVLYVCLLRMPYMYALYVCLIRMPDTYALLRQTVHIRPIRGTRMS